ncbi:(d)CMP kinase [Gracilibacillus oryzae]|uniref:Cytidylate kinase n=1 Tax=Gracilibacillus oryzae TaxID=1672701 RepID=A0A7C8GW00_9BACI|nr:(d)CMP kinase [Gracilibacillus oryzae]KAB8138500.1 (d)CMP kinase [Gracilibacillus oryzae]
MKKIAIAIDGPAAAGKSTIAKLVAQKLNYIYIDTGAMYRSLTLQVIREQIDFHDEGKIVSLLNDLDIELNQNFEVFINKQNITEEIRANDVTNHVSKIASIPAVRDEMVKRQQNLAADRGVVMDGRDIGTRVIPDAEVKIFLIASVEERATRRHDENRKKGIPTDLEKLKKEIENRDRMDSERASSPLKKADDAIEIDTTSLSIEGVLQRILSIVDQEV